MSITGIDHSVTLWLNTLGSESMDPFWKFLSNDRVWFPVYAAVMVFIIWKLGWKKGLVVVASLFLAVLATDQLSTLVKEGIQRLRPCYDPWMLEHGIRTPAKFREQFGFFSSHASNTFGFAIASLMGLRYSTRRICTVYGVCVMSWAVLVSFSRIVLAAHYVGDIAAGAAFGLLTGAAVALLARLIISKARL